MRRCERWLIVKPRGGLDDRGLRGFGGWRQFPARTYSGTANPDRNKSLIHLRFWKVQSTTVQAPFFFPGQLGA
jgi:hypothetical protein